MSEKQFEEFLAERFVQQASQDIKPGFRYQFKSPDNENSERLFLAMKARTTGSFTTPHGTELSYIDTGSCKIIPVLHGEAGSSSLGFTENYISHLRDQIASQEGDLKGCALVIIHNSLLDTLINSADNLASKGQVWSPECIRDALKTLVDQTDKNHKVSECLLDNQFDNILEDGATMFGFEKLFKAVEDGDLLFHELDMFDDPLITQMEHNTKQIKARLDINRSLYQEISYEVENFGEQLLERLKDFSERFIRKHFIDAEPDEWKKLELEALLQEKKNNAKQQLILESENLTSGNIIARNRSESKAGMRDRHVIIELDSEQAEFELRLEFKGTSDLTKQQLKIQPAKALDDSEQWTVRNSFKSAFATLNSSFNGEPTYFTIALRRDNTSENYTFKCLVVRKGQFFLEPFKNVFTVEPQKNKQRITINIDENRLPVNPNGTVSCELTDTNQVVDINQYGVVDFESLANESDEIEFFLQSGEQQLKLRVEGAVAKDSLPLPLLLNKGRLHKLFNDEYNGEFFANKSKVGLDNSEFVVTATRAQLLKFEQRFIDEKAICLIGEDNSIPLAELSSCAPEIEQAYQQLFAYLTDKKSTPSLVSWGDEYLNIVERIVNTCLEYFSAIPTSGSLSDEQRLVLKVGRVWLDGEEFYSPYHPLILSYYFNLCRQIKSDSSDSFSDIPSVTLDRLVPAGLMPYSYHPDYEYSYNQTVKENAFWIKSVPQEHSTHTFIRKLVKEKIEEFQAAFSQLFDDHNNSLIINVVNLEQAEELFLGLVDYIKDNGEQASSIHVNLYDDQLLFNAFDRFAEADKYEAIKSWLGLDKGQKLREIADSVIDTLRTRLTYSKFTNSQVESGGQSYAHLTFFRNNSKVDCTDVDIDDMECSVAADGLLAGEASHSNNGSYYTGFGLANITYYDKPHLKMAKYIGSLTKPALGKNIQYHGKNAVSLAVSEDFKALLKRSYNSSVWTTIIDPKVTLDFFHSNEDVVLIHYSDQYTSSSSYDAITVTAQRHLFEKVLDHEKGGFVDEFNAFNGDWLLKMISSPANGNKSVEQFEKLRKERRGIIGAYKFVTSMVSQSDITWVPLSVAEMIRVSGNLGLKMSDTEFSRNVNGYRKGAISDDVLLVGLKDQTLYLLPLEVKTGAIPDYKKAVEQSKELGRYLAEDILGGDSLLAQLYRSLFIRQILMQVDKYRLYNVFHSGYFDSFLAEKEQWLAGHYQLDEIENYPKGFVVSHLETAACLDTNYQMVEDILRIELPMSLLDSLVSTPLQQLLDGQSISQIYKVPDEYILRDATTNIITSIADAKPATDEVVDGEDSNTDSTGNDSDEFIEEVEESEKESNIVESDGHLTVLFGHNAMNQQPLEWEPTNTAKFMNTNTGIIGTMGTGKTQFTKSAITQLYRNQHNNVDGQPIGMLIFDYKSDYVDDEFQQASGAKKFNLFHLPYNPLSLFGDTPMLPVHTARGFSETVARAFNLGQKQQLKLRKLIGEAYELAGIHKADPITWSKPAPTIEDVWQLFLDSEPDPDSLYAALETLCELEVFETDYQKCQSLYDLMDGITVIELAGYPGEIQSLVVALTLDLFYMQMQKKGKPQVQGDFRQITKMILVDEADNFMSQNFPSLRKILREGREYGVGVILSTQDITHFHTGENDYSSYILTWVIHRVAKIKAQDIKAMFSVNEKADQDRLMDTIQKLDKHYSLYIDGAKNIVKMRDRAFWELVK
ncbi:DNA phosphorothioation-dependent restriction protein DptH [Vibrio viridaestus]|uniref:DNA phosphorothioation-dependent restriction protein DptH n=1 Tax=Vibrio viridaestus TaxID=2487322 RepID=A0A3N9U2Z0_9VIBR|nr:DNA phosphorothioation-dependent restriction protein DptH [Vibrio viridaestus]RQW62376.1 DNA phosphorothioation-dependent restriction protein DptH [Vibrio viridaestus]